MSLKFKTSALTVIAAALIEIIRPPEPMPPAVWAGQHFVLPDGELNGTLIDLSSTPHLVELVNVMGPDSPDNEIVVMKSAQSGFTTALQIMIGHSIDCDPCDIMVVQPTDGALTDFNSQKLGRAIDLARALGEKRGERTWGVKVRPQTARSGTSSTTYEKKFPGGALFLALATSSADLRSKTIKKAFCDEIDEYPDDLNQQGDPLEMVEARQISFLQSASWKRAYISTPRIEGASKIAARYHAGDQRKWHVRCPGCGERFVFTFKQLVFNTTKPYAAHYVTQCCGSVIEGLQKRDVYLTGEWIATAPGPNKYKSYHFDALSAPSVPWDETVAKFVAAGDDPNKLKAFWNLWLGLPYEVKGDAPDHVKLLERREDYPAGVVPPDGLLLVAGCDVQHNGIWAEVVAFAPDQQSWSVLHRFIEGDTTDPERGAFAELVKLYDMSFADSFGGSRQIDALAIDAGDGGRANQVYGWTRLRPRAFAVKGMSGWTYPAIGTPTRVDINLGGKKIKGGAHVWPVGTWSLKATYYANLRKDGRKAGAETDPPGYCHHHAGCDERYFKQQTAEYLKTSTMRGRSVRLWQETGPNHLLDCRVYAMAMADYLGLTRLLPQGWATLRKLRATPAEMQQPDLLAPESVKLAARPPLIAPRKPRGRRVLSEGI